MQVKPVWGKEEKKSKIGLAVFFYKLFIFREWGREGEREGKKHQWVAASRASPTGDLVCNPGMCPDWDLNW